jgi:hypothetical protein
LCIVIRNSTGDCNRTDYSLSNPNAPKKRDLLGTVMLSVLSGHRRYAHVTTLRCDPVNPPLLGMRKIVLEDLLDWFQKQPEVK